MSAVPAVTAVPPGDPPSFVTVTDTDHRAWIIISAAMCVSLTLVTLLARNFIRKCVHIGWSRDETVLAISTVCSILRLPRLLVSLLLTLLPKAVSYVQALLILAACADGVGNRLS